MALFRRKEEKEQIVPNYRTVPSKNGPVIDVFSLDGDGFHTINADDNLLFLSGMTYWQMQLSVYGCDVDKAVARGNASRFFLKLWENKYYETQPLVGWYMALYSVFHENTWSDISRQTMKVFCEYMFKQPYMHTQEAWYLSMMYTSLCGGSIDDVVQWLQGHLENNFTRKKIIKDGAAMALPVLKHYKVLQGVMEKVPFTLPQCSETLADYWDYLADQYLCEEARLEAAFVRIFLAHSPYKNYSEPNDFTDYYFDDESRAMERAAARGILKEAALFNHMARNGNVPALSVVSDSSWRFIPENVKWKLSNFEVITRGNDNLMRKTRDNIFLRIDSEAKSIAERAVSDGEALKAADCHYARGLYLYACWFKGSADEMRQAAAYIEKLRNVKLPEGRLNPAVRAASWLYHLEKEETAGLTQRDKEDILKTEKLAISCRKNPAEVKYRNLGMLLRDGFMGIHQQPELWKKLRSKALETAGDSGITKYILDEDPDMAEYLFKCTIENSDNSWTEKHITAAWLGLAWLRYCRGDYSDLSEILTYIERDEELSQMLGRDTVEEYIRDVKANDFGVLDMLAGLFTQDKNIHKEDPILKDMGKLFARHLGSLYEQELKNCADSSMELIVMTRMVETEMTYAGYEPRLLEYIIRGLDMKLPYFYGLLQENEVYRQVWSKTDFDTMLRYLRHGASFGHDFEKEIHEIEELQREIKFRLQREKDREIMREEAKQYKMPESKPRDVEFPLLDALESAANGGMTNDELYRSGRRSEAQHEADQELRNLLRRMGLGN